MTFDTINSFGRRREPFLFIVDYKVHNIIALPLDKLAEEDVKFCMNDKNKIYRRYRDLLEKETLSFDVYKKKFDCVIEKIKTGDTYLLNLTQPTNIQTSLSLDEIYNYANARYKLKYKDKFVCFSPEKFIQIENTKISTFPMKGTIDASLPNAKERIINDQKEMAEHVMVVDLLRNDLSIVAKSVKVEKFRYISEIEAGEKKLLQVSSHISGDIGDDWHERIGDILQALLPAGSISGTPKKSTLDIIDKVEEYERGFFSGVFGIYDGKKLDSAVMIRFIERTKEGFIYKSGGGITLESHVQSEYNELLDKVYLP